MRRGVFACVVAAAAGVLAVGTPLVYADDAKIVAIAPASDARKAVPIGPAGEVYEPDGKGAWVRRHPGGTAAELVHATSIGGTGATVIAGAKSAAPFKLKNGIWSAVYLIPRARAVVGTGSRVLAAVNRQVFALDTNAAKATKIGTAPARISALAGGSARAVIATDKGLFELVGKTTVWKPIKKAPKSVRALVSERWALVDKGALDLKTLKTIAWPAGVHVDEATVAGDTLVVVARHGKQRELLTLTTKAGAKFTRETLPLEASVRIAGVAADENQRVVVAARDGTLAVRTNGSWVVTEVSAELPADKAAGPPPALCPATPTASAVPSAPMAPASPASPASPAPPGTAAIPTTR